MTDLPDNQTPQFSPAPPAAPQPVGVPPPKSGPSVLKIVLIVVAIFVGLGLIGVGVVGYGIYRVAHAIHTSPNGQVSIDTPGGGISANTTQPVSESDLGVAIYPGATQGKGSLHMNIGGKSMVTANYLTTDSKDQVMAFYKDKAGPDAQWMMTDNGGQITIVNRSDSISVTVLQSPNMNGGKTQITIVHTSGGSSN
jgi:hypothetical protein